MIFWSHEVESAIPIAYSAWWKHQEDVGSIPTGDELSIISGTFLDWFVYHLYHYLVEKNILNGFELQMDSDLTEAEWRIYASVN